MNKWMISCLLIWMAVYSHADPTDRWLIKVKYQDQHQLKQLAEAFDHFQLEHKDQVVKLEVSGTELSWLKNQQFEVQTDVTGSARLQRALTTNQRQQNSPSGGGIAGFACYRTVEETFATATSLVNEHPDLASWIDVGDSWVKTQDVALGYDLQILRISNQNIIGTKPPLLVTSGVHAREYANAELVTRFAEWLLGEYGQDADATWLVDHHDIHLLLQANPDGRKMAETGLSWRKNANNNFCPNSNSRGIDLNRNFSFQWGCCGGSTTNAVIRHFGGQLQHLSRKPSACRTTWISCSLITGTMT